MAPVVKDPLEAYLPLILRRADSVTENPSFSFHHTVSTILPRNTPINPEAGTVPPEAIPTKALFFLFGLIGAGFVVSASWFFFLAKNGGFHFKETDWDDYKSSVLRRKRRDGKTLSDATLSTDLGGGSLYHKRDPKRSRGEKKRSTSNSKRFNGKNIQAVKKSEDCSTQASEMSEISEIKSGILRETGRRNYETKTTMSEIESFGGDIDETAVEDLLAYRNEEPARVGGLNVESESNTFGGSVTESKMTTSAVPSSRQSTKKRPKQKKDLRIGGIRKVISVNDGHKSQRAKTDERKRAEKVSINYEKERRLKAEARRIQEKDRAVQRRDFSFKIGDDSTVITSDDEIARRERHERRRAKRRQSSRATDNSSRLSEIQSSVGTSDIGTKSYNHPIPELSVLSPRSDYAEERRRRRNGSQV
ncbi:putative endosomal spry domain-containing protein [Golovinomyces cichoracearum]|uniref:Putative endosomal spry domain-containing protein n=1 Tax=Golovinomyces cichoracearum TaxID=62708 RepID=A0A420J8V2_9PEZI|nr:putative endosomal spry domain-containing protein [Golovinomyces cichoracearum]